MALAVGLGVLGWRSDVLGVRSAGPWTSVSLAFDPPPPYPGYAWYRDGRQVSSFELNTNAGPDHCGWQSATFMTVGWPIPRVSETIAEARQFIRDPYGAVNSSLRDRLVLNAVMPADARRTGYHHGSLELYVSATNDDAVFVVSPRGTERWPRSDPPIACA